MAVANDSWGDDKHVGEAKADLSAKQYFLAKVDTNLPDASLSHDFGVVLCGAGERPDFVITEPGGDNKSVHLQGLVPGKRLVGRAGGAITVGALLVSDSAGKLVVSTSGTSGDAIIGKALGPADGDLSLFPWIPGNYSTVG